MAYYVYILTNYKKNVLYIGMTGNLVQRIGQHKAQQVKGFTEKYKTDTLIYFESFEQIEDAKKREKAMKKWNRSWKENLINASNPEWKEVQIG